MAFWMEGGLLEHRRVDRAAQFSHARATRGLAEGVDKTAIQIQLVDEKTRTIGTTEPIAPNSCTTGLVQNPRLNKHQPEDESRPVMR